MNSFYYLYLPLLILPLLLMLLRKVVLKNSIKQEWVVLINIVATYLLIIAGTMAVEYYYGAKLAAFDLNGDGLFSGAEVTAEQQAAQTEVERMSARTLAPVTGAIFAFFYSALFYCVLIVIGSIKNKGEEDD